MKLWLDDLRPAPPGWTWVKTFREAVDAVAGLPEGVVIEEMSLDHDLGQCMTCCPGAPMECRTCECHRTGYDFLKWMAATSAQGWSRKRPVVHSANPVGAANMRAVIDRYWFPPRG